MSDQKTEARHVGEYIRDQMKAKGWSQTELSRQLGFTQQYVSGFMSDTTPQKVSMLVAIKLESAFGIPALDWMGWQNAWDLDRHG